MYNEAWKLKIISSQIHQIITKESLMSYMKVYCWELWTIYNRTLKHLLYKFLSQWKI